MIDGIDICTICGAGGSCSDCAGAGAEPDVPAGSCTTCGGSGEEPRLLPTCSGERCGVDPDVSSPMAAS